MCVFVCVGGGGGKGVLGGRMIPYEMLCLGSV